MEEDAMALYESESKGSSSSSEAASESLPNLSPPCPKRPRTIGLEDPNFIPEEENHPWRGAKHLIAKEATRVIAPSEQVFASTSLWKQGFPKNVSSYKKHETRKIHQEDDGYEKWVQNFYLFMKMNRHILVHLNLGGCTQHLTLCSSVACPVKYPVDDITEETPCLLYVPIGRRGNTLEAALGIAKTGHNMPCPADYAVVKVVKIVNFKRFFDHPLDHPIPDQSIETLQDAVNNFILWHRQDIILHKQSPSMDEEVKAATAQDPPPLPVHPTPQPLPHTKEKEPKGSKIVESDEFHKNP